jgi:hypothetical protein
MSRFHAGYNQIRNHFLKITLETYTWCFSESGKPRENIIWTEIPNGAAPLKILMLIVGVVVDQTFAV